MKEELNKEQTEAIIHKSGPLMILAGAGSGKTKVLIHRVAGLIETEKVEPSSIALMTFTNKAADEMKKRIKEIVGSNIVLGFVGTFHTFCVRILREFGERKGISPNFVIFDSEDSESTMKNVIKELGLDPKENKPAMYLAVIGKMKNDFKKIGDVEKSTENYFYKQVVRVWRAYQDKLNKNRALDFDDLLLRAVEVLQIEEVKKIINKRINWILIDEYQDTNKVQFELTRLIAGDSKNLTVVGDASQAIYSFRGADFRNLLLLQDEYPEIKKVELPKNYRSTQTILDSAYCVVKNNTGHPVIKLESTLEKGEKIKIFETADETEEARLVVAEGVNLTKKNNEELAILYRTNAQSRAIEEELIRKGVAYKLVGGVRFYGRAEIKDLLAYLRLVSNKDEEIAKNRIEKIGKRKAKIFFEWLEMTNQLITTENPGTLLNEIINRVSYLDKYDERDEQDVARIENINELLAVASLYKTVPEFLESAALAEAETKKSLTNAKITLMTVHSAKGLEFQNVFVVGLEEGMFPHSRSISSGDKNEIEEERRLMYVAMTRAKEKLILSFARSRLIFGGRMRTIPSRFLSEIDEKLIDKKFMSRFETEEPRLKKKQGFNVDGEKIRVVVQDWEIERETKQDFDDVDNW
jgi:DNA helicase II / ATP-dependent DNA helicase PcrA